MDVGQRLNNRENVLPYSWTQQCDQGTLRFRKLGSAVPRLRHEGSQLEGGVMELLLVQLLAETWCVSTKLADADFVAFPIKGHRSSFLKQH